MSAYTIIVSIHDTKDDLQRRLGYLGLDSADAESYSKACDEPVRFSTHEDAEAHIKAVYKASYLAAVSRPLTDTRQRIVAFDETGTPLKLFFVITQG